MQGTSASHTQPLKALVLDVDATQVPLRRA